MNARGSLSTGLFTLLFLLSGVGLSSPSFAQLPDTATSPEMRRKAEKEEQAARQREFDEKIAQSDARDLPIQIVVGGSLIFMIVGYCMLLGRLGKSGRRVNLQPSQALPMLCIRCGNKATTMVPSRFHSGDPGDVEIPVAGGLVGMIWKSFWTILSATILYFHSRRCIEINLPFCNRHRNHWRFRSPLVLLLMMLGWFAIFAGLLAAAEEWTDGRVDQFSLVGFIVLLAAGAPVWPMYFQATGPRFEGVSRNGVAFIGVSNRFAKAIAVTDSQLTALTEMGSKGQSAEERLRGMDI